MIGARVEENQRKVRQRKAEAYRAMLDEQILYNKLYKESQEAERSSQRSRRESKAQKKQSVGVSTEQETSPRAVKTIDLPHIRDNMTFYGGKSRYVSLEPVKYQRRLKMRTDGSFIPAEVEYQIEEIEELVSQIKRQTRRERRQRRKRLSRLGIESIDRSEARRRLQPFNWPQQVQRLQQKWNMNEIPSSIVKLPSQIHSQQSKHLNPQSSPKTAHNGPFFPPQRQKVISLLRKAKTRGDSLLLKCKKHPSSK